MGIQFEATIERTGRGGKPRTIALIVEGVHWSAPPRRHGHPDTWDDGDGETYLEEVRLAGTDAGCVMALLTDDELDALEDELVAAAEAAADDAEQARAEYLADCAADDTLWDEVPV